MNNRTQKFRVSRLRQLIFPEEVIIDRAHVMTRKRKFPAFWVVKEESIPLRSVASIQITRGLIFSTVIIENSGGPFPIEVKGLPNRQASMIRATIEDYKPDSTVNENPDPLEQPSKAVNPREKSSAFDFLKKSVSSFSREKEYSQPVIEPLDEAWDGTDFDPMVIDSEPPVNKMEPAQKSSGKTRRATPRRRKMDDPLPSVDEVLFSDDKTEDEKKTWINDLVEPPTRK